MSTIFIVLDKLKQPAGQAETEKEPEGPAGNDEQKAEGGDDFVPIYSR
jgi:hypothetical protein